MFMKNNIRYNCIYYSALFLSIFFALILIVTSVVFILGFCISYFTFFIPLIISIICIFLLNKNDKLSNKIIGIFLAVLVIFLASFVCSKYYDLTWDSNTYHKDAVGALKNGWNPVHQNYIDFYKKTNTRSSNVIGDKLERERGLWQTHYAKGTWIIAANFYYLYNNIEKAKILNLILIYILIVFSYFFVQNFISNKLLSFFLAIIFSISPVVLVQAFSYYNDGALYSFILLTLLSFILYMKDNKITNFVFLFCSIVLCANVKFTGFAYAGLICFFAYLGFVYIYRNNLKSISKPTILIFSTIIFSILIVGFNPYVTNTIKNHHPFYPIKGNNSVDIMTHNTPSYFENTFRVKNLFVSLASESDNILKATERNPKFKVPFSISLDELSKLASPDLRISGFGVWFFPIIILSSIIILYYLIILFKRDKNTWVIVFCISIAIILLTLIIKESWWARYTPFIYFVPLMALFLLIAYPIKRKYINNILVLFLSFIICFNLLLFFKYNTLENYKYINDTNKVLKKYKKSDKVIKIIETSELFIGFLYNLDDNDIKYEFVKGEKYKNRENIFKIIPYVKE